MLGAVSGRIACVRIPVGRSVCGAAVAQNKVQRIDDNFMRLTAILPVMPPATCIAATVTVGERIIGVLDIGARRLAVYRRR